MIIDLILDRMDDEKYGCYDYDAKTFYNRVMQYEEGTEYKIANALDGGTEQDVKNMLHDYLIKNGYVVDEIINFINSVNWL